MSMRAILKALGTNAWAVKPDYLANMVAVVMGREFDAGEVQTTAQLRMGRARPKAFGDDDSVENPPRQAKGGKPKYEMRGAVAMIRVWGSLHAYASWMDTESFAEGTSYQAIEAAMREAAEDKRVKTILLVIDSPGGQVDGIDALADVIRRVRGGEIGKKAGTPVDAFILNLGASAAYWIASQCRTITANPAAMVGSIGVYTLLFDTAKMHELAGVKVHLVKAGKFKGTGAPGVAIGEEDLVKVQEDIDGYGAIFRKAVVSGRPQLRSAIEKLADGRVHLAEQAKALGLIDRVAYLDSVVDGLNARHSPRASHSSVGGTTGAGGAGVVRVVEAAAVVRVLG